MDPLFPSMLAVGAIAITMGILFRAGRLRAWAAGYRNPLFPAYMQNAGFAAIPYGAAFALAAFIFITTNELLVLGLFLGALGLCGLGAYVSLKAPTWSKPRWLREIPPGSGFGKEFEVGPVTYIGLWLVFIAAVAFWWIFDLGLIGLIAGLAFILPVLTAAHARRKGRSVKEGDRLT